jgi:hypothetical protein
MPAGKFSAVLRIGYGINQRCAAEVLEPGSWFLYHAECVCQAQRN